MRESKYTAIILKKQPLNEADELITFFTKEYGKVRALAKSVKSPKSKLQQKLQTLFLVETTLTHGKLPKIISAEAKETFSKLRENLQALKRAFYVLELVLKFTPDEQKNEPLFLELSDALDFFSSTTDETSLDLSLAKFKISVLEFSGFGINNISDFKTEASPGAYQLFTSLEKSDFKALTGIKNIGQLRELQELLSDFIEYQLERRVKSEQYLKHQM